MRTLLRIDASIRMEGSHSRALADHFETCWMKAHPGGRVLRRDLGRDSVPHLTEVTVRGFFGRGSDGDDAESRLALSDALIAELEAADEVVVSAPVYNFNTSSALKAWVDHVVRASRTFAVEGGQYRGLLEGKSVCLLTARGGLDPLQADCQGPFLDAVFRFMGFSRVEWIALEGTMAGESWLADALPRARAQVEVWFHTSASVCDGIEWSGTFSTDDRASISELRAAQADAICRGDAAAYAELCTEDVVLMLQGRDIVRGREAFLECERSLFATARFRSIRQMPVRLERQGILVVETGGSEVELDGVSAESANYCSRRKYTHVLRKTARGWRFAVLMSNNSQ